MPKVTDFPLISSVNFYKTEANASTALGTLALSQIGQRFRYVKGGGSALVIGNLLQAPAEDTNFKDMAVQAAVATTVAPSANGGFPIPVTLGGTATTSASQFQNGILVISVTPGIGQVFTIVANDVQATTNGTCNFYVYEQPQVALTTSSKATVFPSLYNGVIQNPTTSTGKSLGGAVTPIAASNYGWIQSGGVGAALADATASTGPNSSLSPSVSTAGCVTKQVSLAQTVAVGVSTVSVSAEVEPVFWCVD